MQTHTVRMTAPGYPNSQPPFDPSAPPPPPADQAPQTTPETTSAEKLDRTRFSAAWAGLIAGGVVLILLLVFILQNGGKSAFHFLGFDFTLPRGVALLLAAIAGGGIMAVVGAVRIFQLRRAYKRATR